MSNNENLNYKKNILRPTIIISIINIFSSLFLVSRDVLIANIFGSGSEVDAFISAFLIPMFIINLFSSALSAVFIPHFIGLVNTKNTDKNTFFTHSIFHLTVFAVFLILIISIFNDQIISLIAYGYSGEKFILTTKLFLILLTIIPLNTFNVFLKSRINSEKKYLLTSIIPIFSTLCSLIFIFIFHETFGIHSLVIGICLGYFLESITLLFLGIKNNYFSKLFPAKISTEHKKLYLNFLPIIGGGLLMSSTTIIDQSMASTLGDSSVSTLYFANKAISFSLGVIGAAIGTVLLPNFSYAIKDRNHHRIISLLTKSAIIILVGSILITIITFFFSELIIQIAFAHGSFSKALIPIVAETQSYYALQLPAYFLGLVGVRFLNACNKNKMILIISGLNVITNIIGNYLLIPLLGVAGIALSTSIVYTLSATMIFSIIYKTIRDRNYGEKNVRTN